MNLTFGQQVKLILERRGMTIKRLAELVEEHTGKPMSRQNMTQRLGRDNFQEQDMRMIAEILGCKFELEIVDTSVVEQEAQESVPEEVIAKNPEISEEKKQLRKGIGVYFQKGKKKKEEPAGEINPYTGKEYQSNSVRMHPKKIGYVQVYDQEHHQWTDMTEWAFLGFQERKKALLGKDYEPPIYLD